MEMMRHQETAVKEAFGDSLARIRSMSLIYEYLKPDNFFDVDLDWYLRELTRALFTTYTSPGSSLRLETRFEKTRINSKAAVPIGLILNELVTNSVKYAYPAPSAGEIRIVLENMGGRAVLRVEDDGPGLPHNFESGDSGGMGLKLVQALTKQIDGICDISSHRGTAVAIKFACV
jgi:two-component sensor histidine kinase